MNEREFELQRELVDSNRLVYLAGPIVPKPGFPVEKNVVSALQVFLRLAEVGIPSLCPQLAAIFPSCHEVSWERWMALDFSLIDRCTHMVMLPGWERSAGAQLERSYAVRRGIIVVEDGALDEWIEIACTGRAMEQIRDRDREWIEAQEQS